VRGARGDEGVGIGVRGGRERADWGLLDNSRRRWVYRDFAGIGK
jgi:hypothetical protein